MNRTRHGTAQRRAVWPPEQGFFAIALAKGAWHVPAQIVQDGEGWHAEVNGEIHPSHHEPVYAPMVATLWHSGLKISEADYRWLSAIRDHARQADPEHPCLHPRRAIDPRRLSPITFEDTRL
jgi:hypothetical protein